MTGYGKHFGEFQLKVSALALAGGSTEVAQSVSLILVSRKT